MRRWGDVQETEGEIGGHGDVQQMMGRWGDVEMRRHFKGLM